VPRGRALIDGRRVRASAFFLDIHPVSNHDYLEFLAARRALGARERPPWMHRPGFGEPDMPVVGVTHADALAYARWAGKRLPTLVEWARATQGDDGRRFPWGDSEPDAARACFGRSARGSPGRRGEREAGRGAFGHYDLLGNVWEWCADGVCVGGFWGATSLRPGALLTQAADSRSGGVGFRCAR